MFIIWRMAAPLAKFRGVDSRQFLNLKSVLHLGHDALSLLRTEDWRIWLKNSKLIDSTVSNANHTVLSCCHLPVSCCNLVDRCGSLATVSHKCIILFFLYLCEIPMTSSFNKFISIVIIVHWRKKYFKLYNWILRLSGRVLIIIYRVEYCRQILCQVLIKVLA